MAKEVLSVDVIGHGWEKIREEFKKTAKESEQSAHKTHSGWSKAGTAVAGGMLAIAGAAVAVGVESVKAASEFESAHVRLQNALKNTKTSWKEQKTAVEEADAAGRHLGFTDTETEDALASMTRATGSAGKALQLLTLAQDISRAKNIDLATASMAVAKASEGQLKPLKALGIDLPVAAGGALKLQKANVALVAATKNLTKVEDDIHKGRLSGSKAADAFTKATDKVKAAQDKVNTTASTGNTIIKGLSERMKGQASDASDTFAGKQRTLKAELDHVKVKIGEHLLPVMVGMGNWMIKSGIPAVEKFVKAFQREFPHIENAVVGTFNVVAGVLNQFIRGMNDVITGLNLINPGGDISKIETFGKLDHVKSTRVQSADPKSPDFVGAPVPPPLAKHSGGNRQAARGALVRARPGGVWMNVAEGGQDEVIEPLSHAGARGGGGNYFDFRGSVVANRQQLERMILDAVQSANAKRGRTYGQQVATV